MELFGTVAALGILFYCMTSICNAEPSKNYLTRRYEMDNKISSHGLLHEARVMSLLECTSICSQHQTCTLALYNSDTNTCELHDFLPAQRTTDQAGWQCWEVSPCGLPTAVANAVVTFTTTAINSVATYNCSTGYKFQGSSSDTVCAVTGQWTGLSGSCELVSCGAPVKRPYSSRKYTTVTYNSSAMYSCRDGYGFDSGVQRFNVTCQASGQWSLPPGECSNLKDCSDILERDGSATNGVYVINPDGEGGSVDVYCDMTSIGGGWTVVQRRTDGYEGFYKYWYRYKGGFGNLSNEFWLGDTPLC